MTGFKNRCSAVTDESATQILIRVSGRVDMETAPDFRAMLLPHYPSAKQVVVDLSGVTFMDTAGVATLIDALKQRQTNRRSLALAGPGRQLMEMLYLTKVDRVFTFCALT